MKIEKTERGFERIDFKDSHGREASIQQSSLIYDDSLGAPGSSAIWIGGAGRIHLNREQVADLVGHLQAWLATGSFKVEVPR